MSLAVAVVAGCSADLPDARVLSHAVRASFADPLPVEEPWASPRDYDRALERDIVRWTNVERMSRGLRPVVWSEMLALAARRHSAEMAQLGYFDHDSPVPENRTLMQRVQRAGVGGRSIFVGENLAAGTWRSDRARQIVQAWMESSGHRENLLRPEFRYLGVGISWKARWVYATQVFGTVG